MKHNTMKLAEFVSDFDTSIFDMIAENLPCKATQSSNDAWEQRLNELKRTLKPGQYTAVLDTMALLSGSDDASRACVVNAEMGAGKTIMSIAAAELLKTDGLDATTLVVCPPHIVYKWRREILDTVPNASVVVLNGADSFRKLNQMRDGVIDQPDYVVLGRVRMRMGFNWRPAYGRRIVNGNRYACCSSCGDVVRDSDDNRMLFSKASQMLNDARRRCEACDSPLWTLRRPKTVDCRQTLVLRTLLKLPTIGQKTARRLIDQYSADTLFNILDENPLAIANLMDQGGRLVFNDRTAQRLEAAITLGGISPGNDGSYQISEYIKRYLSGYFGTLIIDEVHEYKASDTAQGQAMGVIASGVQKVIALTGTLMGGYADDVFFMLYRLNPSIFIEDGLNYNERGSIGSAAMRFMRLHGVLEDIYKEAPGDSHKTARGGKMTVSTRKRPGISPEAVLRYIVPYTVFMTLADLGEEVLPPYTERTKMIDMLDTQRHEYHRRLECDLTQIVKSLLVKGDRSCLGVLISALLRWPDTSYKAEILVHPHTRQPLVVLPSIIDESDLLPKEKEMLEIVGDNIRANRRCVVYSAYSGRHGLTQRYARILREAGFNASVLSTNVATSDREVWLDMQVEKGVEVIVTNPELVKTGLDILAFPTLIYMQTGTNTYTVVQSSRRSWRIGQTQPVDVHYLGYSESYQQRMMALMAQKITVAQSTSGQMPDTGLAVLNSDEDSLEIELTRELYNQLLDNVA